MTKAKAKQASSQPVIELKTLATIGERLAHTLGNQFAVITPSINDWTQGHQLDPDEVDDIKMALKRVGVTLEIVREFVLAPNPKVSRDQLSELLRHSLSGFIRDGVLTYEDWDTKRKFPIHSDLNKIEKAFRLVATYLYVLLQRQEIALNKAIKVTFNEDSLVRYEIPFTKDVLRTRFGMAHNLRELSEVDRDISALNLFVANAVFESEDWESIVAVDDELEIVIKPRKS